MRTALGVALVIGCLGLAGCSLFGKKQTAQNPSSKPFLGSTAATKTETVSVPHDSDGPLPGANGYLAGQALAVDTGRPVKAFIQVKNLEREDAKAAPLDIETDDQGYFTIPMLKVGGHYELIARAKEGNDVISQRQFVQPPNPKVLLKLDKRFTTDTTPKIPEMPDSAPGKRRSSSSDTSGDRTSAVIIEPPVRIPTDQPPAGGAGTNPASDSGSGTNSGSGNPPNPSNIAREEFHRIPAPPRVEVPNPPPLQPSWGSAPNSGPQEQPPAVPRPSGSVMLPSMPTRVPSCGLYGNRLDNFALYDIDGKIWEYRRNRKGRLLLLDFWYHTCTPCLSAIPHLVALQDEYGPYGLEVVSIACETGPVEEQIRNVRAIRGRYHINYITLLSGGGPGKCPVMQQFRADYFPMLVLIDVDGNLLWQSTREGMDDYAHQRLRKMIEDKLLIRGGARTP